MPWTWLKQTPQRAIEAAYQAAQSITQVEQDYFAGSVITPTEALSPSVYRHLNKQLQSHLTTINVRLAEYRLSANLAFFSADILDNTLLERLSYIDTVRDRYRELPQASQISAPEKSRSVIPNSLVKTMGTLIPQQQEEKAVAAAIATVRYSSRLSRQALRLVVIVVCVGLVVQQGSRHFIYEQLVDYWQREQQIFLRPSAEELRDDALNRFSLAREKLAFQQALGDFSDKPELYTEALHEEAVLLAADYERERLQGVKNGLADLSALIALAIVFWLCRRDVQIFKEFLGSLWSALDDSAKAFLIIVSTDMFVGYHSAEGWEALLNIFAHHLGLQENRSLILIFIATLPVVLDAIFKFWIFQYLKSTSPSTETIYKEMDQ